MEAVYPIDLMGLRSTLARREMGQVQESYRQALIDLGIKVGELSVQSNIIPEFVDFVSDCIKDQMASGLISTMTEKLVSCGCGRVELPLAVFETLKYQARTKLVHSGGGRNTCAVCGSILQESVERILVQNLDCAHRNVSIVPSQYTAQMQNLVREIVNRPLVISRVSRAREGSVVYDGIIIDPDFCWGLALCFYAEKYGVQSFVLVTGLNTLPQACRTVAITNAHNSKLMVKIVAHPVLEFSKKAHELKGVTITELVELCGGISALRAFLALYLQWTRFYSVVDPSEITLVKNSIGFGKSGRVKIEELPFNPQVLETIPKFLKRDNVIRALKTARSGNSYSEVESNVLRVIG